MQDISLTGPQGGGPNEVSHEISKTHSSFAHSYPVSSEYRPTTNQCVGFGACDLLWSFLWSYQDRLNTYSTASLRMKKKIQTATFLQLQSEEPRTNYSRIFMQCVTLRVCTSMQETMVCRPLTLSSWKLAHVTNIADGKGYWKVKTSLVKLKGKGMQAMFYK